MKKTPGHSYYRGIRGIYFLWHGSQADPELSYLGKVVNYYQVEDVLREEYKEENQIRGLVTADDEDEFTRYCQRHAGDIKQLIKDIWTLSNS